MTDHVLPLLIVLPIVAAVASFLAGLRWDRIGWIIATAMSILELGLAVLLAQQVYTGGRVFHALAGYPRQYGIELVGDELSATLAVLIAVVAVGTLIFSRQAGPRGNAFHGGFLLLLGGLNGVVLTGDMFNLFVFLEIVGLTTYALVAADRSAESAYASLKYLFLGTIGASLYLTGVGYAFLATGTLNMLELQSALAAVGYDDTLVKTAYGLVAIGLALKIAQFPLHTWQPDAYQYAPDSVTVFISALVSTSAAYALLRISYTVFTVEFLQTTKLLTYGILVLAGISIVAGSAIAAVQSDLKRLFAYSSIAQFGIVVAAIALANETALLGGMVHLIGHGLMKGALFLGVGMLGLAYGVRTVDDLAGLGTRAPYTAGGIAILGLTLVGVPPSVGFIGKWYVAVGAVESGNWPIAVVIFVSTLLTLAYVARILERLYFASPEPGSEPAHRGDPEHDGDPAQNGEHAAVAADGGATDKGSPEATGGENAEQPRVTRGMLALLLLAAVVAVGLGFAGIAFADLFEPVLGRFFA